METERSEITFREIYEMLDASSPLYFPLGGELNVYAVNAAEVVAALLERKGIHVGDDGFHSKIKRLRAWTPAGWRGLT